MVIVKETHPGLGPLGIPEALDPFHRVKACSGTGILTLGGDGGPECRFEAYQRGDGMIVIDCESDTLFHCPSDAQLVGTTATGQRVVSRKAHMKTSSTTYSRQHGSSTKRRLIASGLEMGLPSDAATLRYGLTNLRKVLGNEAHSYTTPDGYEGSRRRIRFRLGSFDVLIEHRPDAAAVLDELSLTHGVALTAEATVAAAPGQAEAVDEVVRKLCHLFTLGQGSAVCWIYRDSLDEHGHVVATFCGDAITKPYGSSLGLVPDKDICAFAQSTFPAWDGAESRWGIRNAILGYTDARVQVDYHELRTLKMAIVIEHLKSVFLERTGREYIMPDALFRGNLSELRTRVKDLLPGLFPSQAAETIGQLIASLQGLHRTSFKQALKGVAAELRLPIGKKELDLVVPIRNRIVHAMQFSKEVPPETRQYDVLATFAGKLILAALEYEGPYYDWTTRPPTLVKLERLPVLAPSPA